MRRVVVALGVVPLLCLAGCQDGDTAAEPHPLDAVRSTAPTTSAPPASTASEPLPTGLPRLLDDPRVTESSGLALSTVHPGVVWTHNDRGAQPQLFALDRSGTRAVLTLQAPAVDWEDVATTPDGRIWIGDIGDNDRVRPTVAVLTVPEPAVLTSASLPVTSYELAYPDGPHDAEALLVHPVTGRLYVVTKEPGHGTVYAAPETLRSPGVNELEAVGTSPPSVSAGDFSPDGALVVLRNQGRAFFSRELGDEDPVVVQLPRQQQGESVAFTADGSEVLVGSEGEDSPVLRIPVPEVP